MCVVVCGVCVVLLKVIQRSREVKNHPALAVTGLEVVVEVKPGLQHLRDSWPSDPVLFYPRCLAISHRMQYPKEK